MAIQESDLTEEEKKAMDFYEKRRKSRGYYNFDEVRLSAYIAREMVAYHKSHK